MSDTVKVVQEQIDEATGQAISRVTVEWLGSDRNTANAMSVTLIEGMIKAVERWAANKADPNQVPPGAIR